MSDMARGVPVGVLGSRSPDAVDQFGNLLTSRGQRIEWRVIAEDRFHDPTYSTTLRRLPSDGVVVETAMRIASGDIIERIYASKDHTIIEFENATPAACAVAVIVDGDIRIVVADRAPMQWCAGADVATVSSRLSGNETSAPPVLSGSELVGLVWPVAHRTTLRIAIGPSGVVVADLPAAEDVLRGWVPHLRRGLTVDIDDRVVQNAIDAARVGALVAAPGVDLATARALEDWGFDAEAAAAWEKLGYLDRRRLRRSRDSGANVWETLTAALEINDGIGLLNAAHDVAIRDSGSSVDLFPHFPAAWLGLGIALNNVPLRRGSMSVVLRWHGNRPALLWECEGDFAITASKLSPEFCSDAKSGEVLLPEPVAELFSYGAEHSVTDVAVAPPGSFS